MFNTKKAEEFFGGPIQGTPVSKLPGVGPVAEETLRKAGLEKLDPIYDAFIQKSEADFMKWLKEKCGQEKVAKIIYDDFTEWKKRDDDKRRPSELTKMLTTKKAKEFFGGPIAGAPLSKLPGVGPVAEEKLRKAGLEKLDPIYDAFNQKSKADFIEWFKEKCGQEAAAKTAFDAFTEWKKQNYNMRRP